MLRYSSGGGGGGGGGGGCCLHLDGYFSSSDIGQRFIYYQTFQHTYNCDNLVF